MAKKSDGGCGAIVIIGAVLFVLGKCSGEPESETPSPQGLISETSDAARALPTNLFVQTRRLNCRASAARNSAIVKTYDRSDAVSVTDYSGDWVFVPNGGSAGCWVTRQNLSESPPQVETAPAALIPLASPIRPRRERSEIGGSCGSKWKCGQMDSCEEAYHYLNQCGIGRLDGDNDGVPCESIC